MTYLGLKYEQIFQFDFLFRKFQLEFVSHQVKLNENETSNTYRAEGNDMTMNLEYKIFLFGSWIKL